MIELVNGFLWVITAILFFIAVIMIWMRLELYDEEHPNAWLIITTLLFISIIALYFSNIKVNIIKAESTIDSFNIVKEKKDELGDNYILEPSILTEYSNAVQILKKYKKLGLYNGKYLTDNIDNDKYCGCSPCECIGECKCTKDYPFPGYERTK